MKKFFLSAIIIMAVINFTAGCTTIFEWVPMKVPKEQIPMQTDKILGVVLITGEVVKFDERGGRFSPPRAAITGFSAEGRAIEIPLVDVRYVRVDKYDHASNVLTNMGIQIGVPLALLLLVLLNL
jgi:hypothetical protein